MFCLGSIISIVNECKVVGITQAKIVTDFFRSFNVNCEDISNEDASNIASGKRNPPTYAMNPLKIYNSDSYAAIASYFNDNIISLIMENERTVVRDTIIMMIQEDSDIRDDTIVEVVSGIKKCDLAAQVNDLGMLLAGVFLYVLRNTQNSLGGDAKKKAKEYLNKVHNGIGLAKRSTRKIQNVSNTETETEKSVYLSREIDYMEERISQEATTFCINTMINATSYLCVRL